jgi:tetratricopeptide (TPR) repeat protein
LSIGVFAVVWEFFGPKNEKDKKFKKKSKTVATICHTINAISYGFTGFILFIVLAQLFPMEKRKWFFNIPFLASAIYLSHPLHTEVVANIKSLDEILSLLGGLGALYYVLKFLDPITQLTESENKNQIDQKSLIFAGLFFFLALMSKESVITFVGVIPLTLIFFRQNMDWKSKFISFLPILGATGLYFIIRTSVIGVGGDGSPVKELMNNPFVYANASEKFATIFFTLGLYLKLLVVPNPLTHDYYPWHPLAEGDWVWNKNDLPYMDWSNPIAIGALVIYGLITAYGLFGLLKAFNNKKVSVGAYCALLFIGTFILFSNLVFPIGSFMNERFLYVPSIAFALFIGWALVEGLQKSLKSETVRLALGLMVIIIFGYLTFMRNPAWETEYTLATSDYLTSKNSSKVNMHAGGAFLNKAKSTKNTKEKTDLLNQALECLSRSIQLYPNHTPSYVLSANTLFEMKRYEESAKYYGEALKRKNDEKIALQNLRFLGDTLPKMRLFDLGIQSLNIYLKYKPRDVGVLGRIAEIYGKDLQNYPKSLEYLNKAKTLSPEDTNILQKLGVVYAMTGQPNKAVEVFLEAENIQPKNASVIMNIGITYMNMGEEELGNQYLEKAFEIDPKLRPKN